MHIKKDASLGKKSPHIVVMVTTRTSMKSSIINRDSGGGTMKSGTGPGVGSSMRAHQTTGLNGILMRGQTVDNITPALNVLSCPVTAARTAAATVNQNSNYTQQLYSGLPSLTLPPTTPTPTAIAPTPTPTPTAIAPTPTATATAIAPTPTPK